jgi:glucose/arabinose dehydrogenase
MKRTAWFVRAACVVLAMGAVAAQTARVIPRPPAQAPGPPKPEDGSAAPDGYAPIPEWLGQTRAPRPAKNAAYDVETVAEGLTGAFCFTVLPDGRMIVGERPGRIRIVGKDGKISEPIEGMPADLWARGSQGLFDVRPDRAFATNRAIYLTYTVLPEGTNAAAPPRSPGVLVAASAKLSADDRRLDNLKVLLNAEGTGGRAYFPRNERELRDSFAQIQTDLREQYLVAYSSSNKTRDGLYRRVAIEIVNPETRRENLRLNYRPGYFAKTPDSAQPKSSKKP